MEHHRVLFDSALEKSRVKAYWPLSYRAHYFTPLTPPSARHVHKKSTHLVVQLNVKGSGVSGDRGPLNSLTRGARQPDGVLARRGDADGVGEAEGSKERHDEGGRVHCGKLMCVLLEW